MSLEERRIRRRFEKMSINLIKLQDSVEYIGAVQKATMEEIEELSALFEELKVANNQET